MATIAFDGYVLAADSLVTNGDHVFGHADKIHKLKDGSLFAAAGGLDFVHAVKEWLEGGDKPEIKDNDSFIGLWLVSTEFGYDAIEISQNLRKYPACIPWAGGTGEQFALTDMKLGKCAVGAVKVACEMDIYSGGKIMADDSYDTR